MIDIVKQVQARNPALGSALIVLRADSRALDGPEQLTPEARDWITREAPSARLTRETVSLAPYPGGTPIERIVTVISFANARELAAFATAWTADPLTEDE